MALESIILWYLGFVYLGTLVAAWPQILGGLMVRPFSMIVFLLTLPVIYPCILLFGLKSTLGKIAQPRQSTAIPINPRPSVKWRAIVRRASAWSAGILIVAVLCAAWGALYQGATQEQHTYHSSIAAEKNMRVALPSSIGTPNTTEQAALTEGAKAHIQELIAEQSGDRTALDRTQQYDDMRLVEAAVAQSGKEMAGQSLRSTSLSGQ